MGKVIPFRKKDDDNTLYVSHKDGKVYGSSKNYNPNTTHEERMQRLIRAIKSINEMFEEYKKPPRT